MFFFFQVDSDYNKAFVIHSIFMNESFSSLFFWELKFFVGQGGIYMSIGKREAVSQQSGKQTKRPLVLASIMLAMFMGAIEGTIVSTAMPAIVGELGGFSLYSWVFSAYLLMMTVTVLIYGKLSDLFGRKPVMVFGIILFLIGSLLAGLATSMKQLIAYRFIQGFGAGAVMPIATTIVGDIYSKEERAKVQGYLSSVWGISAIMGPAIGGFFVEYVSWKWVFWVNIPIGLLAMIGIILFLHENIEKKKPDIDYKGAVLLTIALSALMIVLVQSGVKWAWLSFRTIGLLVLFAVALIFFIFQEKRASEPMMPFNIWKIPTILIANIVSFTTGLMLIGISSFLPAFVQGVMEKNATIAGFTLTAMSIGWPLASSQAGKLLLKMGARKTSLIGAVSLMLGTLLFVLMTPSSGPMWAATASFFVGIGMGLSWTSFIVSIQSAVTWKQRGIATAANMFMRNLGNTVGAALLGGILNNQIMSYFKSREEAFAQNLTLDATNALLHPEERASLSAPLKAVLQEGLTVSLHTVYLVVFFFAVISFGLLFLMPKKDVSV